MPERIFGISLRKTVSDMKKIVVFTGSGISAESGLATFRGDRGTWAEHKIEDVCTPEALVRNRTGVIDFYNRRRREIFAAAPNPAHIAVRRLEECFDVTVITQNIDNLHERAGSSNVIHLHGEITKLCSSLDKELTIEIDGRDQLYHERHPDDGSPLRPFIVFFGEPVPLMDRAVDETASADILIVVGTSLQVYPAASLLRYTRKDTPVYLVDPARPHAGNVSYIEATATLGLPPLVERLMKEERHSRQTT